jgi:hypothetical protein
MNVSYTELNGEGKVNLILIAGVHGDEIAPVFLLNEFLNDLERFRPYFMKAFVINGVNPSAIKAKKRDVSPENMNDLNRGWFSNWDKSDREKLTRLFNKVMENGIHNHYPTLLIDVHASPHIETCMVIDADTPNEKNGIIYLDDSFIEDTIDPYTEYENLPYITNEKGSNSIKNWFNIHEDNGLVRSAFTLELNGMNGNCINPYEVSKGLYYLEAFLTNVETVIEAKFTVNKIKKVRLTENIYSPISGLYDPSKGYFGSIFNFKGEKIFSVDDYLNMIYRKDFISYLKSGVFPKEGFIVESSRFPTTFEGDLIRIFRKGHTWVNKDDILFSIQPREIDGFSPFSN